MTTNDDLKFWYEAHLDIRDIRLIRPDEPSERFAYTLPSSAFVYFARGSAAVGMDAHRHRIGGDFLLHGGKGMSLTIEAGDSLEFYLILYKAKLPSASSGTANDHPSQRHFAMTPLYPGELRETAERMYRAWRAASALNRLQAKSLFQHFVYHAHWQLQRQPIIPQRPSLFDQAIQFMNDHYAEPITVDSVAHAVSCSPRYLNKLFHQKREESPARVLTRIRLEKAKQLLAATDLPLHEIAKSVAYSDIRALSRIFKKLFGVTPQQYRSDSGASGGLVPKRSGNGADRVIVASFSRCYIENGNHNQLDQDQGRKGEESHMWNRSKPSIAAVMLVCFAVILGACGSASNNNDEGTETASVKSYTDQFGTRDIPTEPKRIYAIGAASALITLGIEPAGAPKYEVEPDYYLSSHEPKINVVGDYPPDYEAILALKPDLILASDYIDAEVYGNLAKVAPTATFQWAGQDIYDQLNQIGDIVGKPDEAKKWIEEHKARAEKAKQEASGLVGADETVSILWISKDSFQVVGNRNVGHVLYSLLGLKPHPAIQKLIDDNKGELVFTDKLSLEALPEYDADRLIVMVSDVEAGSVENFKAMQQSGVWKTLKAVKNNRVYEVPYDKWWSYTILSADGLLEDAAALFKK
ncbi:ABC transporter substrate-binding protein [Cohnella sp. GCM10027633]|uniref:ABC transporter substrate-binding protein n=1 Tax=unclassified Cohnella TaxID=2636738 RepID=UPI003627D913